MPDFDRCLREPDASEPGRAHRLTVAPEDGCCFPGDSWHGTKHSAKPTGGKHEAPSTNRVIRAKSQYALVPKSMRPKGVIVPRF
jgi:hypothetical protein